DVQPPQAHQPLRRRHRHHGLARRRGGGALRHAHLAARPLAALFRHRRGLSRQRGGAQAEGRRLQMILLEMISYPFLVRAFLVGVLVSLCAALLGTSLVLKRYWMIGDGLSHVGFGALAIASALGVAPLAVAVPVVVVAAV